MFLDTPCKLTRGVSMNTDLKTRWLRPSDLEEMLGMSKSRQARLRCDGKLGYHKVGSYVYYDVEVINNMIEEAKVC